MNKQIKSLKALMLNFAAVATIVISGNNISFAQDANQAAKDDKPVSNTFNSGIFLENQTYMTNGAKVIECVINHRFGALSDGSKIAWGLYAPSNIRLGVDYGVTKNVQLGIGATKNNLLFDGDLKWNILKQTNSGKVPVSVTYFGDLAFNGSPTSAFADPAFKGVYRLSYFNEIMIAYKFCNFFNLQIAPTFSHYNLVETANPLVSAGGDSTAKPVRPNNNFGLSTLGKLNIDATHSFMFEYDVNFSKLKIPENDSYKNPQPVIALGFEIATSAHSFQFFVSTGNSIVYQQNMVYNQNYLLKKNGIKSGLAIGFNITRVFF